MSEWHTGLNVLRTAKIADIKTESPSTKTFTLNDKLCHNAKPGQFVMLWIPGIDEIPLSILSATENQVSVTVKAVGDATRHLHDMKVDDFVGVRGPFGNCFTESSGKALLVGGGTGTAPLVFLAKRLAVQVQELSFVIGAKTKSELLFVGELDALCTDESAIATTEDGSYGLQCLATEPLERLLKRRKFDIIYTCGPEQMMRKLFDLAEHHKIPLEASLERLMRCGIGLCGSCVIGKYRVCRDGPVFNSKQLHEVKSEFGLSKLGFNGDRIPL